MKTTPKRIKEIAAMLYLDEDGPQWQAMGEWRVAPSEATAVVLFVAILAQAALLHQEDRRKVPA